MMRRSATIGAIGGTSTGVGKTFSNVTPSTPVKDPSSQTVRSNLVKQFNDVVSQINTTSRDASFNGINLLNGDDLKLTFNETGTSTLNIKGVTFNAAGLGDARRHQRGSGEQPGAVHPPVDRGVRPVAGQPVPAERAPVAPLNPESDTNIEAAGETPPPST